MPADRHLNNNGDAPSKIPRQGQSSQNRNDIFDRHYRTWSTGLSSQSPLERLRRASADARRVLKESERSQIDEDLHPSDRLSATMIRNDGKFEFGVLSVRVNKPTQTLRQKRASQPVKIGTSSPNFDGMPRKPLPSQLPRAVAHIAAAKETKTKSVLGGLVSEVQEWQSKDTLPGRHIDLIGPVPERVLGQVRWLGRGMSGKSIPESFAGAHGGGRFHHPRKDENHDQASSASEELTQDSNVSACSSSSSGEDGTWPDHAYYTNDSQSAAAGVESSSSSGVKTKTTKTSSKIPIRSQQRPPTTENRPTASKLPIRKREPKPNNLNRQVSSPKIPARKTFSAPARTNPHPASSNDTRGRLTRASPELKRARSEEPVEATHDNQRASKNTLSDLGEAGPKESGRSTSEARKPTKKTYLNSEVCQESGPSTDAVEASRNRLPSPEEAHHPEPEQPVIGSSSDETFNVEDYEVSTGREPQPTERCYSVPTVRTILEEPEPEETNREYPRTDTVDSRAVNIERRRSSTASQSEEQSKSFTHPSPVESDVGFKVMRWDSDSQQSDSASGSAGPWTALDIRGALAIDQGSESKLVSNNGLENSTDGSVRSWGSLVVSRTPIVNSPEPKVNRLYRGNAKYGSIRARVARMLARMKASILCRKDRRATMDVGTSIG
ncbi:hypothetical protein SCAR479_03186 [Seiridium cardinale]|uniref:Uncharacterized protein n=1 Tax=Seiridium cardinale TaxID=138064 RepID=A0ABR2Y296_9PEZI